ncbi:MAG: TRAP transporter substrate-binding protein [Alcaligenaceae bacterium]
MKNLNRRKILVGAGALGASLALPSIVLGQAPVRMKCANIMPADHPVNVRLKEAADKIREQTNEQVNIQIFPASQLGTDADMLAQLRSGGIDFFLQTGLILSSLVPVASINGIGFAFSDYARVWAAMDGKVGQYVINAFSKANLVAFDKMWDNGFRQTLSVNKPIKAPADLASFKIRVPPSPLWTSMFKDLGASPVSIPWGETYSALQTKVADGLENPLAGIFFAKMHEVGKYISNTNHMWDGFWFVANRKSLEALPATARDIVIKNINEAALKERADVEALNVSLKSDLVGKGIQFVDVDPAAFRVKLQQSGFYAEWKKRMGDELWGLLESYTAKL